MIRKPMKGLQVLALSALFCFTGCLGPNHSTGHIAQWNASFEGKWAQEGIFLVTWPAWIFTTLGDMLIFNSWQWWSGQNPISRPERSGGTM